MKDVLIGLFAAILGASMLLFHPSIPVKVAGFLLIIGGVLNMLWQPKHK